MAIRQRRLFQSESVERETKKNMVQGEEDQNEEVFLVALTAHEERLLFVRRAAHALPHTPRLALTATPEGSMEVRVKIYDGLLLTRLL